MNTPSKYKINYINARLIYTGYITLVIFVFNAISIGINAVNLRIASAYFGLTTEEMAKAGLALVTKLQYLLIVDGFSVPLLLITALLCLHYGRKMQVYTQIKRIGVIHGILWLIFKLVSTPLRYQFAANWTNKNEFSFFQIYGIAELILIVVGLMLVIPILTSANCARADEQALLR